MVPLLVEPRELKDFNVCDKLPAAEGKVAIVTGANIGLGRSTAKHLSSCSRMKVIMACR